MLTADILPIVEKWYNVKFSFTKRGKPGRAKESFCVVALRSNDCEPLFYTTEELSPRAIWGESMHPCDIFVNRGKFFTEELTDIIQTISDDRPANAQPIVIYFVWGVSGTFKRPSVLPTCVEEFIKDKDCAEMLYTLYQDTNHCRFSNDA